MSKKLLGWKRKTGKGKKHRKGVKEKISARNYCKGSRELIKRHNRGGNWQLEQNDKDKGI